MGNPILDEMLAEERQREMLRLAEYARQVSAVCNQTGAWRSSRYLMLRAFGHTGDRIDRAAAERAARCAPIGRLTELKR